MAARVSEKQREPHDSDEWSKSSSYLALQQHPEHCQCTKHPPKFLKPYLPQTHLPVCLPSNYNTPFLSISSRNVAYAHWPFSTSSTLPLLSITYSLPSPSHAAVLSALRPLLDTEMGQTLEWTFQICVLKKKKKKHNTLDRVWNEIALMIRLYISVTVMI